MNSFPVYRGLRWSLTLVLAVAVVAGAGQAQAGNRAGFLFGLNIADQRGDMEQVGLELAMELQSEFGGNWVVDKSSSTGLGLGGYYLIENSPTLGLQIEAQYIRRGTKLTLEGTGIPAEVTSISMDATFKLDYLEIPLLVRFSPNPEAKFRPIFLAGPVLGIKVGANLEAEAAGFSQSTDISEGYKDLNFGLLGGVGFAARVGEATDLVVQARYFLGLSNVLDEPQYEAKSQDIGFFAGMEFPVGKGAD